MPRKRKLRNPYRPVAVVDVPTAAALLDTSPSTLYRWMSQGELAYLTLPSGVRRVTLPEISKITGIPVPRLSEMVTRVTEPGKKYLEASGEVSRAIRAYYRNVKAAKAEGKPIIWSFGLVPREIFNALDAPVIYLEHLPIMMGAKQLSGTLIQAAEEVGFSRDICAFHACFIGIAASDERGPYLERLFEPPDFIVASNYPCMSESHSFLYSVQRFDVPYFFLDAPINVWGKEAAGHAIEYYAAQLRELLSFLERHGYKTDWTRLQEAIELSRTMRLLREKIDSYRKAIPCPMGPADGFNSAFPAIMLAGTKTGVELTQRFRDELKIRVENKMGVVEQEKLRLFLMGVPPFYNLGLLNYPEEKYGAVFVKCMVEYLAGGAYDPAVMDPERPLESLARRTLTDFVNPTAQNMVDFIVDSVKEFRIDGVVELNKRGCRLLPGWLRLIKDAVYKETGVPSAIFDLDGLDLREYNDAQVKANIDAFIETLL